MLISGQEPFFEIMSIRDRLAMESLRMIIGAKTPAQINVILSGGDAIREVAAAFEMADRFISYKNATDANLINPYWVIRPTALNEGEDPPVDTYSTFEGASAEATLLSSAESRPYTVLVSVAEFS